LLFVRKKVYLPNEKFWIKLLFCAKTLLFGRPDLLTLSTQIKFLFPMFVSTRRMRNIGLGAVRTKIKELCRSQGSCGS
jgi:hypothetical protein